MKKIIKKIIQFYLKFLSKIAIKRHKPEIIAIAGSTGKHTIKKRLNDSLSRKFSVRMGKERYNAEIGVPLTILGLVSDSNKASVWLPLIFKATKIALWGRNFPEKLILELGISRPKDTGYFLSIIKPHITILTNINNQYVDNFGNLDLIAEEYKQLVKATSKGGLVILNKDDLRIKKLNTFTDATVLYYGEGEGSDMMVTDIENKDHQQCFGIRFMGKENKIVSNKFGIHHIYGEAINLAVKNYYNI